MKYEPYNFDSFKELVAYGYRLGWYSGTQRLFTLTMEGAFEGWSGRATEDWEQRFVLRSDLFTEEIIGKSVKEVCDGAMKILSRKSDTQSPQATQSQ